MKLSLARLLLKKKGVKMDFKTEEILKTINSHLKIKNFLTNLSYFFIIGGLFIYFFYAFSNSSNIKVVKKYKEKGKKYETEKVMTNPRIKLQREAGQIYDIRAKKAVHKDEKEIKLYDVFAVGDLGNITAGELKIDEESTHFVFSNNPVMILHDKK